MALGSGGVGEFYVACSAHRRCCVRCRRYRAGRMLIHALVDALLADADAAASAGPGLAIRIATTRRRCANWRRSNLQNTLLARAAADCSSGELRYEWLLAAKCARRSGAVRSTELYAQPCHGHAAISRAAAKTEAKAAQINEDRGQTQTGRGAAAVPRLGIPAAAPAVAGIALPCFAIGGTVAIPRAIAFAIAPPPG
jgi:hypothetical protein